MNPKTEPVATAGAATILATMIITAGKLTGARSMSSDEATALAGAIIVAVTTVGTVLARRKVTPVARPVHVPQTPPVH